MIIMIVIIITINVIIVIDFTIVSVVINIIIIGCALRCHSSALNQQAVSCQWRRAGLETLSESVPYAYPSPVPLA